MKHFILLITLLITNLSSFGQQDTIVYYKNHVPQTTIEGADYQYIVRQKNKSTSIVVRKKFRKGKWIETQSEKIKLKGPNTFHVDYGKKEYLLKTEKIGGGYIIQSFNEKGQLISKGVSRSLFPLHREGQWHFFKKNMLIATEKYKAAIRVNSYLIGNNQKKFLNNSFANVNQLAKYKKGMKNFQSDLKKNLKYPKICLKNRLQAQVIILFAIDSNGAPTDFHIQSETNQYFNHAAISAIQSCGKWKPAMKDNKAVSVYNIVPVNFSLR